MNLLLSCDQHELAGWESGPASLCHIYFQSPLWLAGQSDKRETSCPQWRGMYECVFVGLRAPREGKWENARGQIFVAPLSV